MGFFWRLDPLSRLAKANRRGGNKNDKYVTTVLLYKASWHWLNGLSHESKVAEAVMLRSDGCNHSVTTVSAKVSHSNQLF